MYGLFVSHSHHSTNPFQSLFNVPEDKAFLDIFNEEVRLFKEKVSHLTSDELVYYVEEEGNPELHRFYTLLRRHSYEIIILLFIEEGNLPDDDKARVARGSPSMLAAA